MDDKRYYYKLFKHKEEIEKAVQCKIGWFEHAGTWSAVSAIVPGKLDFDNQSNYVELINRTIDITVAMMNICLPYLREGPDETDTVDSILLSDPNVSSKPGE